MIKNCEFCSTSFVVNFGGKRFCCDKCRVTAWKQKRKAEDAKPDTFAMPVFDDRTPVEKAVDTKRDQLQMKHCKNCYEPFDVNGLQKRKKFCCNACKMAYHRRYDFDGTYTPKPVKRKPTTATVVPMVDNVQAIVNDAWSELSEN